MVLNASYLVERERAGDFAGLVDALGRDGFELELTRRVAAAVGVPVIASGGAGSIADFVALFRATGADAALAASIFHSGDVPLAALKAALADAGIPVRPVAEAA
jgi:imidazole glycerol phosphate synthase subunit HisF